MSFMHISNWNSEYYFDNLKNTFWGLMAQDAPEWIVVAIVGGSVIGFLVSFSYMHLKDYLKKLKNMKNYFERLKLEI